ncbi:MAG: ABC transporter permease, partial [Spirochaetaceae bacterium]|nr:ABC transporter permease [Spirochaetaceae bacterium]
RIITNINEIRSFHLRIEGAKPLSKEVEREILGIKGINSVIQFADVKTIIRGFFVDQEGAALRIVDEDVMQKDSGFAEKITMTRGAFDLSGVDSIVLGSDLAAALGVRPGDKVSLLSLAGEDYKKLSPVNLEFTVTGIFKTGYYEINSTMAFVPMKSASLFIPESDYVYGIKLDNHYRDREVLGRLKELSSLNGVYMESWRNYNRSFFSALLMEKVMMMVLISLIFVVVAVNIFHSMKRSVVERIEEIALMKAVGATAFSIQSVFIMEGAIIGILGSLSGVISGYLISYNINSIFDLIEKIINFITSVYTGFLETNGPVNEFTIYSGNSYYLQEVPIKIMTPDVIYITAMALFSALAAAWYASRQVTRVSPVVALRYE